MTRIDHRLRPMETLKTVAIADDEPGILKVLEMACGTRYCLVGQARNGVEAIELVKFKQPQVLVLDLNMPVLGGLEALRQIVIFKTTAVVILTATQDPETARQAMELGA